MCDHLTRKEQTDGPLPPAKASCTEEQVDTSFHPGSCNEIAAGAFRKTNRIPRTPVSANPADVGEGSEKSFGYFDIHERYYILEGPSPPSDGFGTPPGPVTPIDEEIPTSPSERRGYWRDREGNWFFSENGFEHALPDIETDSDIEDIGPPPGPIRYARREDNRDYRERQRRRYFVPDGLPEDELPDFDEAEDLPAPSTPAMQMRQELLDADVPCTDVDEILETQHTLTHAEYFRLPASLGGPPCDPPSSSNE